MNSSVLSPRIGTALHVALILHAYSMLAFYFTDRPLLCAMIMLPLVVLDFVYALGAAVTLTLEYVLSALFSGVLDNDIVVGVAFATVPVLVFASRCWPLGNRLGWSGRGWIRNGCVLLSLFSLALIGAREIPLSVSISMGIANAVAAWSAGPARSPRRFRERLATGALLFLSLLASLVLLEGGARLFVPDSVPQPGIFKPHPKAIVDLRPSVTRTLTYRESSSSRRSISAYISPQGIRELKYGPKSPDEFRVLLLGDSFTFGLTVSFLDTIGHQLERMFAQSGLPRKVTVINLGVPGTGPWQHEIYLDERGFAFEPDLVIEQLYLGNDLHDTLVPTGRHLHAFSIERAELIEREQLLIMDRFRAEQCVAEHSRVYATLRHWIGEQNVVVFLARGCRFLKPVRLAVLPEPSGLPPGWEVNQPEWYPEIFEALDGVAYTVDIMRAKCHARGVGFAVYTIPLAEETAPTLYERSRRMFGVPSDVTYMMGKGLRYLDTQWRDLNISAIPVFRCMRAHPQPETLYRVADSHTSEAGNALIAQCIYDYIMNEYFPVHPIESPTGG